MRIIAIGSGFDESACFRVQLGRIRGTDRKQAMSQIERSWCYDFPGPAEFIAGREPDRATFVMRKKQQVFAWGIVQPCGRLDQRGSVGIALTLRVILDADDRGVVQVVK